ncbi:uncharacterized protein [Penaeus vannamei]|uniref:uncharacterized protein n=1 Tax=Penaeus vannamei TaxID=6689 RepID=UPI00387F4531
MVPEQRRDASREDRTQQNRRCRIGVNISIDDFTVWPPESTSEPSSSTTTFNRRPEPAPRPEDDNQYVDSGEINIPTEVQIIAHQRSFAKVRNPVKKSSSVRCPDLMPMKSFSHSMMNLSDSG